MTRRPSFAVVFYWASILLLFPRTDARGGFGSPRGMMRNLDMGQQARTQPRKKTVSVKPTFIQTESPKDGGVDHVVLLKVDDSAKKLQLRKLQKGVHSLASIDGVESVTVGEVLLNRECPSAYNYYMRLRFSSVEHLKSYQNDPLHKKVQETCIKPILVEPPLAVDCAAAVMRPSKAGATKEQISFPQQQLQRTTAK